LRPHLPVAWEVHILRTDELRPTAAFAHRRSTKRFGDLYRGRAADRRELGRSTHEMRADPDVTMLARLSVVHARARSVPLAA
jgi:hypothetical protein